MPAASLAATTRPRLGVIRKVWVMVWWRNSPVRARMPTSRATPEITLEGAATRWRRLSAPRGGLPWVPETVTTKITVMIAKPTMAASSMGVVREVRSLASSARIRRVMTCLLGGR